MSILNVWLRDEKCRPFKIDYPSERWDYVRIENCHGDFVKKVTMPAGQAHVEIEVPPGCYRVSGHVCERGTNEYTDTAMVIAGCNQKLCVNLIVPSVETCAHNLAVALAAAATLADIPVTDIVTTTQTIMRVGNIVREDLINELQIGIRSLEKIKERADLLQNYKRVMDIVQKIK